MEYGGGAVVRVAILCFLAALSLVRLHSVVCFCTFSAYYFLTVRACRVVYSACIAAGEAAFAAFGIVSCGDVTPARVGAFMSPMDAVVARFIVHFVVLCCMVVGVVGYGSRFAPS